MYTGYAEKFQTDIIVFYYNMNMEKVQSKLHKKLLNKVIFVFIDFGSKGSENRISDVDVQTELPHVGCQAAGNVEVHLASTFFVEQAASELFDRGYTWYFRFADDSRLKTPIEFNVFEKLIQSSKKYGFISVTRACVDPLWKITKTHCDKLKSSNATNVCSSILLNELIWPSGVIMFTDFEISHHSLWKNSLYKWLIKQVDKTQLSSMLSTVKHDVALYSLPASVIHSIGALMILHPHEIHRFNDIRYENTKRAKKNLIGNKLIAAEASVIATPLPVLDAFFKPYRFGWLGGDVASSFALPEASCFGIVNGKIGIRKDALGNACKLKNSAVMSEELYSMKYIWLFGDSLVGTSSDKV